MIMSMLPAQLFTSASMPELRTMKRLDSKERVCDEASNTRVSYAFRSQKRKK